jgi:hypothetical protein
MILKGVRYENFRLLWPVRISPLIFRRTDYRYIGTVPYMINLRSWKSCKTIRASWLNIYLFI